MKTDSAANRPTAPRPKPMKPRTVRAGSEWDEASAVAESEGLVLAEVIRHYLREYVAGSQGRQHRRPKIVNS